jgi:DNA-binding response OmpR family regulator
MPKMNGFEMCSTIRRTAEIADSYIIMSSTLGSAADQQRGFQSGVDEYITKPVVIPELLDRIKKVFCSARTGRENVLLLVEQDAVAKNIAKSLGKQGFSTQHVHTMKQAVKLVKRMSFDLLISDMFLEDGTSMVDLIAIIRTLAPDKQPDILILTSRDNPGDEKMVRNAGAAGVISKPFTMDSLLAAVERTLSDRRATQERTQIEKYISKASRQMALEKAILGGKSSSTRADKKTAVVFFSDIAGFTTRCETYGPKEIVSQINKLFDVMTRVIMENGGDIDKFIGDACVAFWMDEDPGISAQRAIRTLLELRKHLDTMNKEDPVLAKDPIHIRVGLNMGEVILCDIGSAEARIDLTVIGDTVNIAARLESASKQYGLSNLIGGPVIRAGAKDLLTRPIDIVRVKGKNEPVECHELLGLLESATEDQKELVATFNEGFRLYTLGDFTQAKSVFAKASALELDPTSVAINPSKLYMERCSYLEQNPPKKWDGTWKLDSK